VTELKGKIGALVFLTAILVLSAAASGLNNTITLHVQVAGEKTDILTMKVEKVAEDKKTMTVKFTDVDMAIFQYHFAIAAAVKHVDFTVTDIGPGYYIATLAKKDLKGKGSDYTIKLPRSVLKKNIDTGVFSQYEGAEYLIINAYAKNKYLRTFIANMGVDIATVNMKEGYLTVYGSYQDLLALYLAGFEVEVVADLSDAVPFELEPEYYTYPEVVSELSQIETDHSSIAEVFSMGTSYEDRDIPGIKISDNVGTNESEPEVFICAMHHAREAATVNVAMYIINYLTDNYGSDQDVTNMVDTREIYIIPIVNPDGKVYDDSGGSYGSGRNWRKNRQPCSGGIGTDPNRNYSYGWGGSGSSGYCTSDTFRGYDPFDAPCTAAVRDFVNAHTDITILLTYHSYGNLVLWPWGYTYDPISDADDREVHETLGEGYASYTGYTPQQASDLYLASGTTDDWSYGVTKDDAMPIFSFTVELSGGGFYPSPSVLPGMCSDNTDGVMYLLEYAEDPYSVLPQPEPLEITNPSAGATVSGTVSITCDAEPEIAKVEFYIDSSLESTDTTSPFSWDWDTTQESDGSHTILVKGYDSGDAFVDDDTINVTVDNAGECLGTVLLGMLMLFGSAALSRRN
jgi:carboxypeptidase T